MKNIAFKVVSRFRKYADRWWYPPLVALLAALDAFIVVVPNEALLIPAVLLHPRRWISITLWVTLGSAIGAACFAELTSVYGEPFVHRLLPEAAHSKIWLDSVKIMQHHSLWGLSLISFSPFPQHAAVAIAGLAHISPFIVLTGVFLGRVSKYMLVSWLSLHSPKILRKFKIIPEGLLEEFQPKLPGTQNSSQPVLEKK